MALASALFVYSVALFFSVKGESNREVSLQLYKWIPVGSFQINVGFLIDPLSLVFVLLITGVGGLIHIYSLGYMEHDEGRRRFFGQFNLFIAAMLLLVLADNYLVLYVGWEGVGLASYLLIGFYYNRPTAATAAKKAFIANRVGDVGLSIGDHDHVRLLRHHVVRRRVREHDRGQQRRRDCHRADAPARCVRQVRPVPAADMVAGRHGGSDAGVGPDPCRDHGHRRRLPHRAVQSDLQRLAVRSHCGDGSSAGSPCFTGVSAPSARTT